MKWFKHYSNADSSLKLQKILDEMGVEGYAHYWLLLELLCEKYDGESTIIELHFNEISAKVRIKFSKKLEKVLQKFADFSLFSLEIRGKVYKINAPILLKLKQKDFKRSRPESDSVAPTPPLRDKIEDKRIKNIYSSFFDIEALYQAYPRKVGKTKGIEKLKKIIKSESDYQNVKTSIENYAGLVKAEQTDKKYIKHFSSFISNWEDYLEIEPSERKSLEDELRDFFHPNPEAFENEQ